MRQNSNALKLEPTHELPRLQILTSEETTEEVANSETLNEEPTAETVKPIEEKKQLTIDEIKRKNEVLRRLTSKYDDVSLKLWRIENFKISADRETATVQVTDASGEEFQSNSPKTIGKLIEFWTDEFKNALAELEKEIRENA